MDWKTCEIAVINSVCNRKKAERSVSWVLAGTSISDNKTFKLYLPNDQELLGFNGTNGVEGRGGDLRKISRFYMLKSLQAK